MITFLPVPSFTETAKILDWRRLNSQRREAKLILKTLRQGTKWIHHPVNRMWVGYEYALAEYYNEMVTEWIRRGYQNTMQLEEVPSSAVHLPPWFGNTFFHLSHQSNLVRKFPEHYRKFFPDVPDNLPYIWPTV